MTELIVSGIKKNKKTDTSDNMVKSGKESKSMKEKKGLKESDYNDKKSRCNSIVIDGTKYRTFYNRKFEKRKKYAMKDPNKIFSYIPGTVLKLYVKVGQEVHKGDNILILEAMKMKNRLTFDRSGIVKTINVLEGEKVPKDFLMIEMEQPFG
jgi:biotin carboxyl carrier protein